MGEADAGRQILPSSVPNPKGGDTLREDGAPSGDGASSWSGVPGGGSTLHGDGAPSAIRRPPLVRKKSAGWVAGAASAIADHVGWPVWLVRWVFVLSTVYNYLGLGVYAALWILIPVSQDAADAPGIDAASRAGMRTRRRPKKLESSGGVLAALGLLGVGAVWLIQANGFGVSGRLFLPLVMAATGVAIIWWQSDHVTGSEAVAGLPAWLRPFAGGGRFKFALGIFAGLGLVGAAVVIIAVTQFGLAQLTAALAMSTFMVIAVALVMAPWLYRWRHGLQAARDEKLKADARADFAAHLHDSVLQTLALIQNQATDPKAVGFLARRQERELRTWLYGETANYATVKAALGGVVAEIEDERGVLVELVCVGDLPISENVLAVVQATREAVLNAAKHSKADVIDVYAEVSDEQLEVFVRDRGIGFDLDQVAEDRMGVRGSICERMERHGGKASIRSKPGEGTEVRLEMKL